MTDGRVVMAALTRAAITTMILALAGCVASGDHTVSTDGAASMNSFATEVQSVIVDAEEAGVDEAQMAVLEHAATTGKVTYDENERALLATFDCFESIGVTYERRDDTDIVGFRSPNYTFSVSDEASDPDSVVALADACITEHSDFVSRLYQTQPAAGAARDALFAKAEPSLVACLVDNGVEVDEDASPDELVTLALELYSGPNESGSGPDCMMEAGLVN